MLSEQDIEAAHPDAFDFVWGNLPAAKRAEFNRHLSGCPYCQAVVSEYSTIGRIIKLLPPHVEPTADLEDRTVAAMAAALAEEQAEVDRPADTEDRTTTQIYRIPELPPSTQPETLVQPVLNLQPAADQTGLRPSPVTNRPTPTEDQAGPIATRLPGWRRHRGRLAAVVAVAAAIIVTAIVFPLTLGRSPTGVAVVIPLHATTAANVRGYRAASGRATARQDASGSWKISLTVSHLESFGDTKWYECWYVSRTGQVASAGTFQVPDGGIWTFPMTSAVDPRVFRMMEITIGPPSKTGAMTGLIVLSGQATL